MLSSAESNFITDVLNAPPVEHHLTNWGIWAWIGMILLFVTIAAASTFVAALIPDELDVPMAVAANIGFGFYAATLYPILRHIPWTALVWVIGIALACGLCFVLSSMRAGNPVSYAVAIVGSITPAALDAIVARHLAAIPMSWAVLGLLLAIAACAFLWGMIRH